jgi:putative flippase GtrA
VEVMQQFKKFCLIGGLGFVVDSLFFFILNEITDKVMLARLLSFWLAASATWFGNRIYTFRHQQCTSAFSQWCKHLLIAHLSGAINLLVFWLTKDTVSLPIAFCLGIFAGLFSNYFLANHFVFVSSTDSCPSYD